MTNYKNIIPYFGARTSILFHMTDEERQIVADEAVKLSEIVPYSYDKYVEFMQALIEQHPFSYFSIAKGMRFNALWKDILEKTSFIDSHFSPKSATRIFYYVNKLTELKRCETCNKEFKKDISPVKTPAHFFCCNRCAQKHESTVAKTKATKLKNHGDPNYNNIEKIRATCKERFGVECSWQAKEVQEKSRQSIREHFGVDHQMHSQEVKDRMKAHYKEQHGVEYSFQDPDVIQKIKAVKSAHKKNKDNNMCKSDESTEKETILYSLDCLRQKIFDIIESHPNSFVRIIKSSNYNPSILKSLKHYCPKVADDEYNVQTKIYWFLNDIEDFPKCHNKVCNNTFEHRNVLNWKIGYRKHCCQQCAKDSDERKALYVKRCREKYGVGNASQAEEVKQKKVQSALDKYGVDNVAKAHEVQETIQATNLNRYHAKTYMNSEKGKEVVKNKCLEKYNVEHYSQTTEYLEKCIATNQANYGVDWPQQNREFMRNMQKRYTYEGLNFDSKPELAYYIWLKDNNIEFTYQPDISFEYEFNNVKHIYEPDFIVEGTMIEIKGDHFFREDGTMQNPFCHEQDELYETKHQCMIAHNVRILRSKDYKEYIDYVEKKYGKDYLRSFKNVFK